MAERFKRLFTLTQNLYAEGAPVIIAAGALLKDNETGRILAQLKFKNISSKTIKALKVRIVLQDSVGRVLDEEVIHEYLDLSAPRDAEFGQKNAAFLPNAATRSFTAEVTEAAFTDNSIWTSAWEVWEQLPAQRDIEDKELLKQYRIHYGKKVQYKAADYKDLWLCACGAVNRDRESTCHSCTNSHSELISCDWNALREEENERLRQEEEAAARALEEEKRRAKAKRKKLLLTLAVLLILAGGACAAFFYFIPRAKENKAAALIAEGKYQEAYAIWEELGRTDAILENKKERAAAMIKAEDYEAAYAIWDEIGDHGAILKNKEERAEALIKAKDYEAAYALWDEIGDSDAILRNKYERAMALVSSGDLEAALALLDGLDYEDSEYQKARIEPLLEYMKLEVGDETLFGTYEQDDNSANGREDIEWIVLAKEGNKLLLISKYALECKQFHTVKTGAQWEISYIRTWLNGTFISTAFSTEEQLIIATVTSSADKNPNYSVDPGNDTEDRVFLLSIAEAEQYFSSDSSRVCRPTAYAKAQGAQINSTGGSWWWLRTPGNEAANAAGVGRGGGISYDGVSADFDRNVIRPALWIDLGS